MEGARGGANQFIGLAAQGSVVVSGASEVEQGTGVLGVRDQYDVYPPVL